MTAPDNESPTESAEHLLRIRQIADDVKSAIDATREHVRVFRAAATDAANPCPDCAHGTMTMQDSAAIAMDPSKRGDH